MKNIPVMLCCNDGDHGLFSGELARIEFGDDSETLCLECNFVDWSPPVRYVTAQRTQIAIELLAEGCPPDLYAPGLDGADWDKGEICRVSFLPGSWCDHVGNWCWDRALLSPEAALFLLNWLKKQKAHDTPWFSPTVAEETLWKVWETDGAEFTLSDLQIITGESVNNTPASDDPAE